MPLDSQALHPHVLAPDERLTDGLGRPFGSGDTDDRLRGCIVTIGTFDGVHRGHRALIGESRAVADRVVGSHLMGDRPGRRPLVAMTFDPHPRAVLDPNGAPPLLTTLAERQTLLRRAGADAVLAVPFDRGLASWPAAQFVQQILVAELGVRAVVVGEDFTFGQRATGNLAVLGELGTHHGFDVVGVPLTGASSQRWSSTEARAHLARGDVAAASAVLGRSFSRSGRLSPVLRPPSGCRPGLGLSVDNSLAIPADGTYPVLIRRHDTRSVQRAIVEVCPADADQRTRAHRQLLVRPTGPRLAHLEGVHVDILFTS